jgi:hypothetical protein
VSCHLRRYVFEIPASHGATNQKVGSSNLSGRTTCTQFQNTGTFRLSPYFPVPVFSIVVNLPCTEVERILEANGYATANNWPDPHGWLFGNSSDHPTGTQVRQKPGPYPSENLHLILHDSTEKCPLKTCTIDGIHNDPNNPLNHPIDHALWDLIPYRLGW